MNKENAFSDFKYTCSNCGEEICLNDSLNYKVSSENPLLFCSEKCLKDWLIQDGSKNDRNSFHEQQYDFFR
jgi:hypothetical protein